ncbi:SDR family oxidoreductase [Williamsia serinedens]|uniref:NAD(P)-dependent dehydrogenase, short-chain alcohol dehydrogenase family n=1 Tax=Williamsia serinedens TaxID=391736 RepID=A0ABT1GWQ5_9NOCA|nr:SDR family oxidoreductase [Williamsia serinedens]MCP2159410.1 NAD(P)-dependent dehydrogenase, short-chain alcohol dehydrogenase family [Williamsia serinedens]
MPTIDDAVVLVTGANGGLGEHFVRQALARGARKVYAAARRPRDWGDDRIVPIALDVTNTRSRADAVARAADTTILINNAGTLPPTASLLDLEEADLRATMETNFFAPVLLARAFASTLNSAQNAALVDVHSVASWYAFGGAYSASKAALWSATNALRLEFSTTGVHVVGVHMGYVDTPMAAGAPGPKLRPEDLVAAVYDTLLAGGYEVIGDDLTASVKAALASPVEALYPELAAPPTTTSPSPAAAD